MNGVLILLLNTFCLIGIVLSAIATVQAKKILTSVLALDAVGAFVGLEFILLQAPDVAISEVAVGAVLSTLLYLIAIQRTRVDKEEEHE